MDELGLLHLPEPVDGIYRLLMEHLGATPADLARLSGMRREEVDGTVLALEELGLVTRSRETPSALIPMAPGPVLEARLVEQERAISRARAWVADLDRLYRSARASALPEGLVELVSAETGLMRQRHLAEAAREEALYINKPPYLGTFDDAYELETHQLREGIRYRSIYEAASFDGNLLTHVQRCVDAGEEARSIAAAPIKLAVFDRCSALVPIITDPPMPILIVQAPVIVHTLVTLFELLWEKAVPIRRTSVPTLANADADADTTPTADVKQLLILLAAGTKDDVIAATLGIGVRTAERRIAALMRSLGATTRFQAGLQARDRGWL